MTPHRVLAVATVVAGLSASATTEAGERGLEVRRQGALGTAGGSVWGLFVGVSEYADDSLELEFAARDAGSLHAFYRAHLGPAVPPDHWTLLTDGGATRARLLGALNEIMRRAFPEDLVIIGLAMHGLLDADGELYLAAHDTDPGNLVGTGVSRSELMRLVGTRRAGRVVILLDACHAAGLGQDKAMYATRSAQAHDINRLLAGIGAAETGVTVLASASAAELAQEGEAFGGGHGAFTWCLLQTLGAGRSAGAGGPSPSPADMDGDGLIGVREAYEGTYRCVKAATAGVQHPSISGRFDGALPLAYATAPMRAPDAAQRSPRPLDAGVSGRTSPRERRPHGISLGAGALSFHLAYGYQWSTGHELQYAVGVAPPMSAGQSTFMTGALAWRWSWRGSRDSPFVGARFEFPNASGDQYPGAMSAHAGWSWAWTSGWTAALQAGPGVGVGEDHTEKRGPVAAGGAFLELTGSIGLGL